MKKLFLLGMLLMSGFLLSACDGFNQDTVDQLSEELCRENPTHELCNIENLDTAAESAVEELVLDAIEALKAGDSDVCDTIFAITNTDLLDDCKDGSLLPTGVTAFTVIETSKDGDSYIFKGSTSADAFLEITVSVGSVDGNMRITGFETKTIDDPNPPAEVTAEEFIKEFFVDYQDDALTFDQVNSMYLNDTWTTDEETEREKAITDDVVFTITTIVLNSDGNYDVTYTQDISGVLITETIEVKVVGTGDDRYLEFVEEQDAECTVDCNEEPNPVDETTVELLFNAFILGYLNAAFTDEQLADVFLGGVMNDGFKESRAEDLASGTLIELLSVEFAEGDMYNIELQFTKGEEVTTQVVAIHVNMEGTTPVIVFDDMDNDCDGEVCYPDDLVTGEEATAFINDYFMSLSEMGMSNQLFADIFLGGYLSYDFDMFRTEVLENETSFQVELIELNDDGSFVVEYKMITGDDIIVHKRPGRIHRQDDQLIIEWEAIIDDTLELDLTFATEFFTNFVRDYFDPLVTDEVINTTYLGGMDEFDMIEDRQYSLEEDMQIVILSVEKYDEYGTFAANIQVTFEGEVEEEKVMFQVRRLEDNTPVLIPVENNEGYMNIVFDFDAFEYHLINFVNDYNNKDFSVEDMIMKYFVNTDSYQMINLRIQDHETDTLIELVAIQSNMYGEEGIFEVTFSAKGPNGQEELRVYETMLFMMDNQYSFMFYNFDGKDDDCDGFDDSCQVVYDVDLARDYMQQFIGMYNAPTISTNELYFYVYNHLPFLENRDIYLSDGLFWVLEEQVDAMYDGYFLFVVKANDGDVDIYAELFVKILEMDNGFVIKSEDFGIDEDVVTNIDEFDQQLFVYIDDYNNMNLSEQDFIINHFMFSEPYFALEQRKMDSENGLTLELFTIEPNMYGEPEIFRVTFRLIDGDGLEVELRTIDMVLLNIDNQYSFIILEEHGIDDDCDGFTDTCEIVYDVNVARNYMQEFIDMYNDASLTTDQLYMYVYNNLPFLDDREMHMNDGLFWVLEEQVDVMHDGYFLFLVKANDGDVDIYAELFVKILEIDNDFVIKSEDYGINEDVVTNIDEFDQQLLVYIEDYNNMSLSEQDFISNHFMFSDPYLALEQRKMDSENGLELELFMIESFMFGEPEIFRVTFKLIDADGLEVELRTMDMVLLSIDNQYSFIILEDHGIDDDCNMFDVCEPVTDPAELLSFMQSFLAMYNDPSITIEQLAMYIDDNSFLLYDRDMFFEDGVFWTVNEPVEYLGDNYFLFRFEATLDNNMAYLDLAARVYFVGDGYFIVPQEYVDVCEFDPSACFYDPVIYDGQLVEDFFNDFLNTYIASSVSFDELNQNFLMGNAPSYLADHRDQYLVDGTIAQILSIEENDMYKGFFDISYRMTAGTLVMDHTVTIRVIDYGMLTIEFFDEYNECHINPDMCYGNNDIIELNFDVILPFLDELFLDLNDDTITTEEISMMYFLWGEQLPQMYQRDNVGNPTFSIISLAPSDKFTDEGFLELTYTITYENEEPVFEDASVKFYYSQGKLLIEVRFDMDDYIENDLTIIEPLVQELFTDLNDETISIDLISESYFLWMMPSSLGMDRDAGALTYVSLTPNTEHGIDSFFDITYEVTLSDESVLTVILPVVFLKTDVGLIIMAVQEEYQPDEVLEDFVFKFFDNVSDNDVTTDDICQYVDDASQTLCTNIYNFHQDNNYTVVVTDMIFYDDGTIEVMTLTENASWANIEENTFLFAFNADNDLYTITVVASDNPLYTQQ